METQQSLCNQKHYSSSCIYNSNNNSNNNANYCSGIKAVENKVL